MINVKREVSQYDNSVYEKIRKNIRDFLDAQSRIYDKSNFEILDIAPQVHAGAREYFTKSRIFTADIDKNSNADFIIDICQDNSKIVSSEKFDLVVCTEVLEHTLQPFSAIKELYRILKVGGVLLLTTPFDFRIHGPLPDCWRFTEHGLRAILNDFRSVEITGLENEERFLMPYHYTSIAIK